MAVACATFGDLFAGASAEAPSCRGALHATMGGSMTEQMALRGGSIGWAAASEDSFPRGIPAIWTLKY